MEIKNVYLAYDGRYYKIGMSKDPINRIKRLKRDNPSIKLISFSSEGTTEAQLHKIYKDQNVYQEWFKLTPTQVDEVLYLLKNKHKDYLDCDSDKNPIQLEAMDLIKELKILGIAQPRYYFCKIFKHHSETKATKNRLTNLWYMKTTDIEFNKELKLFIKHVKENVITPMK